jgi:hypothetical protein
LSPSPSGAQVTTAQLSPTIRNIARDFTGRQWLLGNISAWLEDIDDSKFMLITGPPGIGKTALCAWLCGAGPEPHSSAREQLQAIRRQWNSFHFCSRRLEGASIDPRSFVRRLATHMASSVPAYAAAALRTLATPATQIDISVQQNLGTIVGIRTDHLWVTGRSISDGFSEAIKTPIDLLAAEQPSIRLALLVDGLDEALAAGGTTIAHLVATMGDLPDNVKILVTTKNDRRINDLLPAQTKTIDLADTSFEPANRQDVLDYVNHRTSRLAVTKEARPSPQEIAAAAGTNFQYARHLLDELSAGASLAVPTLRHRLPANLPGLYRAYLDRLIPSTGEYGRGEELLRRYLPLLELLSVAFAPISREAAVNILGWSEEEVTTRADELQQLIDFQPEGEYALRYFHSSMADFIGLPLLPDRSPNPYYAPASRAHSKVASVYLRRYQQMGHLAWSSIDQYGLGYLAEHIRDGISEGDDSMTPTKLYSLAVDESYRAAQLSARMPDAMLRTASTALDFAIAHSDVDAVRDLIEAFALANEPQLHGLAADGLARSHASTGKNDLLRLLSHSSPSARQVALNAAYYLGFEERELFEALALSDDPDLPRMAAYMAYLKWSQGERDRVMEFTEHIADGVRVFAPRDARKRLSFLGDITIILYTNFVHDRQFIEWGDGLWWRLLTKRLHVKKFNRGVISTLVTSAAAMTIAQRLGEAVMVDAIQSPEAYFNGGRRPRELLAWATEMLQPGSDLVAQYSMLAELLDSDVAFLRVIGAIVLSAHCTRSLGSIEGFLTERFVNLTPRARLWHLLGFGILAPTSPDWLPFVERQTSYLLEHDRDIIVSRDSGALRSLNFILIPLGLACGKAGVRMAALETTMRACVEQNDRELLVSLLEALALVGLYYPNQALAALQAASWDLRALPGDELTDALAIIGVLHPQAVDLFLVETSRGDLRISVTAKADVARARRAIDQIAFFNSAVYQAARNPIMRERITIPALRCLNESNSVRQFAGRYARILLDLAREYDYHCGAWTVEE